MQSEEDKLRDRLKRWRACDRKRIYSSKKAAKNAVKTFGKKFVLYECWYCKAWHLRTKR